MVPRVPGAWIGQTSLGVAGIQETDPRQIHPYHHYSRYVVVTLQSLPHIYQHTSGDPRVSLRRICQGLHHTTALHITGKISSISIGNFNPVDMVRTVVLLWSLWEIWWSGLSSCCRPVFVYWEFWPCLLRSAW